MTTLLNGYTPELTATDRCRNLAQIIIRHIGKAQAAELTRDLLARYGEVTPDFERELTALAREHLGQDSNSETVSAMLKNRDELWAELNDEPVSSERAESIMGELASIEAWLQKEMQFAADYAEGRSLAKYHDSL